MKEIYKNFEPFKGHDDAEDFRTLSSLEYLFEELSSAMCEHIEATKSKKCRLPEDLEEVFGAIRSIDKFLYDVDCPDLWKSFDQFLSTLENRIGDLEDRMDWEIVSGRPRVDGKIALILFCALEKNKGKREKLDQIGELIAENGPLNQHVDGVFGEDHFDSFNLPTVSIGEERWERTVKSRLRSAAHIYLRLNAEDEFIQNVYRCGNNNEIAQSLLAYYDQVSKY
jgi:hypothetical protein